MREFSVPEVVEVDPSANMTDAVFRNAAEAPDAVAFLRRAGSSWAPVSAKDFATQVRDIAAGLVASGIGPGDRVGLMSRTRFEWTLCDYAIWTAGAVTVPIYETSSAEQVSWILADSGARAAFVESDKHQAIVDEVKAELPDLTQVWQLDGGALETLSTAGRAVPEAELDSRREQLTADDLATIIYTSGTTGRPKGCELSHLNLLGTSLSASKVLPQLFNPDGSTLLFLPLAHVFGRLIQGACVQSRVRMGHTADIKNLTADLAVFQPTFILSVPRVFEKFYNTAKQLAHAASGAPIGLSDWLDPRRLQHNLQATLTGPIFDRAEAAAIAYSQALQAGGASPLQRAQNALFDRLVYSKLRAFMGGKIAYAVSGGAPLGARLGHFFRGAGITVLEGYGLTETTASGTLNLPDRIKVGSVGQPAPGCTVRIADDGEILLSGLHIFGGYWHNETATGEAIEPDGFFHTGDIGELDPAGFLTITGRKKELIVTAGGKNVAPAVLEDRLRAHPMVSQCIVVGDNRPFIGCLVTIDVDSWPTWRRQHGKGDAASVADLREDPDL
ncbi:MAG: AMP-dependent synthetase/ligase, partial [Mycobacteriales bacterium]